MVNVWGMKAYEEWNNRCERCNEEHCICGDEAFEKWLIEELDEQEKERENSEPVN